MKIYLDFDGTMVLHRYPDIGEEVPGAVQTVKDLIAAGHEVILNTYRVDIGTAALYKAIEWLKGRGIKMKSYRPWKYHPITFGMIKGDYYIDDFPKDAPLLKSGAVDWSVVRKHFGLKQIDEKN